MISTERTELPKVERLEFGREVPTEYRSLIADIRFIDMRTPYSTYIDLGNKERFSRDDLSVHQDSDIVRMLRGELTEYGTALRDAISGRVFLDFGCGSYDQSILPRLVAEAHGASRYIGVDKYHPGMLEQSGNTDVVEDVIQQGVYQFPDRMGPRLNSKKGDFSLTWTQDDILGFVSKIKQANGLFVFISGIEPDSGSASTEYVAALKKEIIRLAKPGDGLFFSHHSVLFDPSDAGYTQVMRRYEDEDSQRLYIKE
ncbi:MAG: hypothetical protein Q8P90_02610 [bacterium]|nr:hypothetical protein [bacterium]